MTGRSVWPLCLLCFCAASVLATPALYQRAAQSQAICSPDFNWADNSQNLSPCSVSAAIFGSCGTGNWNMVPLQPGNKYDNPNATSANSCACSWTAYNLISACTACQGLDASIANWAAWDMSCSSFKTDIYFPSNVTLPTGTAIPFWASTNPATWNDGRFNVAQAKTYADEDKPDLVQTPPASAPGKKSKPPIGPIVGGVVGGLGVLAIGGMVAFWLMRNRRHQRPGSGGSGVRPYISGPHIHGRSMSDISGKSILIPQSMSVGNSQRPGTIYTTGTMHTHTGSVHSLSYGSGYTSPVRVMSPPPTQQLMNREDVIEPFTLRPTSPLASSIPRKASETTMRTAYNNLDAPRSPTPTAAFTQEDELGMSEGSHRMRLNPPAYSPYPSPTASPEPIQRDLPPLSQSAAPGHGTRREKASVDTQQSYESVTSRGGGGGIDDMVERMGLTMPGTESVFGGTMGGHTVSTGRSATVMSHPTHKPNVSNPDNDTLG
ncbi:hypothetical protein C8R43DRAFT_210555 [Mycena crocata]|nr:hypothetical protein C8R43DRAFT_210555 [Mycena crocata]